MSDPKGNIILKLILLNGVCSARLGESENAISPETPTPHNQYKEEKIKRCNTKREQTPT